MGIFSSRFIVIGEFKIKTTWTAGFALGKINEESHDFFLNVITEESHKEEFYILRLEDICNLKKCSQ